MKTIALVLAFAAAPAFAEVPVGRVVDDAKAVDRVVEMTTDKLPTDVLRRIVTTDIELLRGTHPNGTYDYAHYERLEGSRISNSFSIKPTDADHLTKIEVKGDLVYRVVLTVPERRLIVAHNRPVYVDHVEVEYLPQGGGVVKRQLISVATSLTPGSSKTLDVDAIARQATVRVYARTDKQTGYGNLDVMLLQANIFDNIDSPYADAVTSEKAILRALDREDLSTIRTMAQRVAASLEKPAPAARTVEVTAPPAEDFPARAEAAPSELLPDLQSIEDLLTGSEAERREGLDRLHQLIRKLRTH